MQGPSPVLNVLTLPPGATNIQARLVLDGIRGAIFVYQNGGPTGALIGSWAISAGTDPYTNAYPQGLDVALGSITGTVFNGVDFILNSSGLFFYSGTPAHGNLIVSIASVAGTDGFTNAYVQGITTYSANVAAMLTQLLAGTIGLGDVNNTPGNLAFISANGGVGASQGLMTLNSGLPAGGSNTATVKVMSESPDLSQSACVLLGIAGVSRTGTSFFEVQGSALFTQSVTATTFLALLNGASTPSATGQCVFWSNTNNRAILRNSDDTQTYSVGQKVFTTTVDQPVTSASTVITNLQQSNVSALTYYVRGCVSWTQGATAVSQNFWFNGPTVSALRINFMHVEAVLDSTTSQTVNSGQADKIGSGGGASMPSPAFGANVLVSLYYEGTVTFSATGTFGVSCGEGTVGDSFTIKAGSFMVVSPV
jgi:hypothetical protein